MTVRLSVRKIESLKPAPAGKRYQLMDEQVPGFGVRVTDSGQCTFILRLRYPGSSNLNRRALGNFPELTLDEAREKARKWRDLVKQGKDPAAEEKPAATFASVAADWFAEKVRGERKAKDVEREVTKEFVAPWGKRPITEITPIDVVSLIKAKKRTAPAQARNLLAHIKRLMAWAADQHLYGFTVSPIAHIKPAAIVGEKASGSRVLTDEELAALWRAAGKMGYPCGSVYRILILTGLRLNEVADARRSEFDLPARLWIIPAERMKGKNHKARPHAVPLTDPVLEILQGLPRLAGKGGYLFTTTFGEKPVWMGSKIKAQVDALMGNMPPWTNHDIRRTVRSGLSRLKISEEAREAVLAHVRPGIKGTYDRYEYLDEKREALELWAERVDQIVSGTLAEKAARGWFERADA
jgi:integrase